MITKKRQQGVALIAVIFLLVALGALAVYLVTVSGVQQQTPTLSADTSRAYYIARSAAEAIGQQASEDGSCPATADQEVEGFQVQIDCSLVSSHEEAGEQFTIFEISATASQGEFGSGNFVSRTVGTRVRN